MDTNKSVIKELSNGLAAAVEKGSVFTVLVSGRGGYPASGVYCDPNHVLASSHSVHMDEGIRVMTPDGAYIGAKVTGRDPVHDLVLLELEEETGSQPQIAQGSPRVGELVLALARPSEDGVQSSLGVVGVSGGTYIGGHGPAIKNMIRSDAAQFPGFSGGPLIDIEGKLLGVNIMGRGGLLTVPAEKAFAIAQTIAKSGNIKQAYLGVRSQSAEISSSAALGREQSHGLLIVGVEDNSPAGAAGLMTGDIITAFGEVPVSAPGDLLDALVDRTEGDAIKLEVLRGGEVTAIEVALGGREYEHHGRKHHGRKRRHRR